PVFTVRAQHQRRIRCAMIIPCAFWSRQQQWLIRTRPRAVERRRCRKADPLGIGSAVGSAHVEESIAVANALDVRVVAGAGSPLSRAGSEGGPANFIRTLRLVRHSVRNLAARQPASHAL